jgi:hypothetical protein
MCRVSVKRLLESVRPISAKSQSLLTYLTESWVTRVKIISPRGETPYGRLKSLPQGVVKKGRERKIFIPWL